MMTLDNISGKERELLTRFHRTVIISRSQIKMSCARSIQNSNGCQKGPKKCSNIVNQRSDFVLVRKIKPWRRRAIEEARKTPSQKIVWVGGNHMQFLWMWNKQVTWNGRIRMENQRIQEGTRGRPQLSSPRTTAVDTRRKDPKVKDGAEGEGVEAGGRRFIEAWCKHCLLLRCFL